MNALATRSIRIFATKHAQSEMSATDSAETITAIAQRIEEAAISSADSIGSRLASRARGLDFGVKLREKAAWLAQRNGPLSFVLGYLGHSKRPMPGLYRAAAALCIYEMCRTSAPASHEGTFQTHTTTASAQVALMEIACAAAGTEFIRIEESPHRIRGALSALFEHLFCGGNARLLDVASDIRTPRDVSQAYLYRLYDLRAAATLAGPLAAGAALAGAEQATVRRLSASAMLIGRALSISRDCAAVMSIGAEGASGMLHPGRSLVLWFTYRHGGAVFRKRIAQVFESWPRVSDDRESLCAAAIESGACAYARLEIERLSERARLEEAAAAMHAPYGEALAAHIREQLDCAGGAARRTSPPDDPAAA
jgi:hypothetical protein